jgi:outer membrane autotransporter protein
VGFDYDSWGVIAGVDYRLTPNLIIGLAGSYTSSTADLDHVLGSTDTKSYGVTLYATYYVGALYADLFGGYTYNKSIRFGRSSIPASIGKPRATRTGISSR